MTETHIGDPSARACKNALEAILTDRCLPERVFSSDWTQFLFFEGYLMLDPRFVPIMQSLVSWEAGSCACLVNLGEDDPATSRVVIQRDATGDWYKAVLGGADPTVGWLYCNTRFAASSDAGGWVAYSEQETELGVVGVRSVEALVAVRNAFAPIEVLTVRGVFETPISVSFSRGSVRPGFRKRFLRAYS